jgi:hypothetical protein
MKNYRDCKKKWRDNHKEEISLYNKIYRESHKEEAALYPSTHDKTRKKEYNRKYLETHREKSRFYSNQTRSTAKGRLKCNISTAIGVSLHGNKAGRHWEMLVGYTVNDLKQHLEKQFLPGMTWDNYGKWHIDHRIPISAFNFETAEDIDFRQCWALRNLRPLWAADNIRKLNKLDKPFQPSFAMAV